MRTEDTILLYNSIATFDPSSAKDGGKGLRTFLIVWEYEHK
jgi:hypothetical protein